MIKSGQRPALVRAENGCSPPICDALTDCGYEPCRDGITITLCNCPFDTLAREHPELVCGMNLAMLAAAIDRVARS